MRILTWNINGLATTLQYYPWSQTKSYKTLLDTLDADIICLQETKIQRSKMTRDMARVPGYDGYFSFAKTKHGYSGVAVYVKQPLVPKWTEEGITGKGQKIHDDPELVSFLQSLSTDPSALDAEGRCIIMDFSAFILFNVYFPNDAGEARRDYKMDYHHTVRKRIDDYLKQGRQVILVGDINAVHEEIDHCDPKKSLKEHRITNFKDLPHRRWVDEIITPKGPLVDLCRAYHPDRKGLYTCWNMKLNCRPANFGTRIDYVLASEGLKPWFKYADILPDIMGSDHCPAYADLHDELPQQGCLADHMKPNTVETSAILASNFDEFSDKQKKLSSWFSAKASTSKQTAAAAITTSSPAISLSPSAPAVTATTVTATSTSSITVAAGKQSPIQPVIPEANLTGKRPSSPASSSSSSTATKRKKSATPTLSDFFTRTESPSRGEQQEEWENDPQTIQQQIEAFEAIAVPPEEKEKSRQHWSTLFKPKPVPCCTVHKEPCKEQKVSKKGPNQGRHFYVCSRPMGPQDDPSGDYRCNFFQWKH